MESFCKFNDPSCYGAKELEALLELSSILSNKEVDLEEVVAILAKHLSAERILLTVLNREISIISIEATFGVNKTESKQVEYKTGKGIIGRVIEKGETVLIPKNWRFERFFEPNESPYTNQWLGCVVYLRAHSLQRANNWYFEPAQGIRENKIVRLRHTLAQNCGHNDRPHHAPPPRVCRRDGTVEGRKYKFARRTTQPYYARKNKRKLEQNE